MAYFAPSYSTGTIHHSRASIATKHSSLSCIFRTGKSTTSPSIKRCKSSPMVISQPILQSTSNGDLFAPAYTPRSAPPPPSPRSPSSSLRFASSRFSSPPPAYSTSAYPIDVEAEDYEFDGCREASIASVEEKALVAIEEVEQRMRSWDAERAARELETAQSEDGRISVELRRLGL